LFETLAVGDHLDFLSDVTGGATVMTDIQLSPYVNLQGRAREGMEFYRKVLGGSLELQTMNEQGVSKPAGPGDRITHARLDADGASIIASDGHPKFPPKVGDNMAIALAGTDKGRLTKIFNDLAEGGAIKGPLTAQPSGATVGYLLDKFGINWVVEIEKG
jgi:PhnB protein